MLESVLWLTYNTHYAWFSCVTYLQHPPCLIQYYDLPATPTMTATPAMSDSVLWLTYTTCYVWFRTVTNLQVSQFSAVHRVKSLQLHIFLCNYNDIVTTYFIDVPIPTPWIKAFLKR